MNKQTELIEERLTKLEGIQTAPSTISAMAEIYHNEIKDSQDESTAKSRIAALIEGLENPAFVAHTQRRPGLEKTRKALISKLKQFTADGFFIDLDKILAVYFPKPYKKNEIVEPKELIRKKTTFRVQAIRSEFDKANDQQFGRTVIDENVTYDAPGQKIMNDIYEVESMLAMFSNQKKEKVFEDTFTVRENIPYFVRSSDISYSAASSAVRTSPLAVPSLSGSVYPQTSLSGSDLSAVGTSVSGSDLSAVGTSVSGSDLSAVGTSVSGLDAIIRMGIQLVHRLAQK